MTDKLAAAENALVQQLNAEIERLRKLVDPDAEHARLVLLKDAMDAAIAEVSPKMDAFYGAEIERLAQRAEDMRSALAAACEMLSLMVGIDPRRSFIARDELFDAIDSALSASGEKEQT